jgi:hypothetical protein
MARRTNQKLAAHTDWELRSCTPIAHHNTSSVSLHPPRNFRDWQTRFTKVRTVCVFRDCHIDAIVDGKSFSRI